MVNVEVVGVIIQPGTKVLVTLIIIIIGTKHIKHRKLQTMHFFSKMVFMG